AEIDSRRGRCSFDMTPTSNTMSTLSTHRNFRCTGESGNHSQLGRFRTSQKPPTPPPPTRAHPKPHHGPPGGQRRASRIGINVATTVNRRSRLPICPPVNPEEIANAPDPDLDKLSNPGAASIPVRSPRRQCAEGDIP